MGTDIPTQVLDASQAARPLAVTTAATSQRSALPLAALATTTTGGAATASPGNSSRSGAAINLFNATLVLPPVDFLALLALAADAQLRLADGGGGSGNGTAAYSGPGLGAMRRCVGAAALDQAALLAPNVTRAALSEVALSGLSFR